MARSKHSYEESVSRRLVCLVLLGFTPPPGWSVASLGERSGFEVRRSGIGLPVLGWALLERYCEQWAGWSLPILARVDTGKVPSGAGLSLRRGLARDCGRAGLSGRVIRPCDLRASNYPVPVLGWEEYAAKPRKQRLRAPSVESMMSGL